MCIQAGLTFNLGNVACANAVFTDFIGWLFPTRLSGTWNGCGIQACASRPASAVVRRAFTISRIPYCISAKVAAGEGVGIATMSEDSLGLHRSIHRQLVKAIHNGG